MKIIHVKGIAQKYSRDVKELLRLCDREFVPPLSARDSTSQTDFTGESRSAGEPVTYYNSLCHQENFFVIENRRIIAMMSFVRDYVSDATVKDRPNVYISTLIVHPEHRRKGLANKLYAKMLKAFGSRYIFTRTWSTNEGHIRILSSLKFYEHMRLEDDRGPDIDTVYYRREPDRMRLSTYLHRYRLHGNIIFFTALMLCTLISIIAWGAIDSPESKEIFLAFATSLLASAFCLISDTFIKIKEARNDDYINKLKSFGIANLQFHKDQLLEQILPSCRDEIWISGYRLIMTGKRKFLNAMQKAASHAKKRLSIRLMAVPPWSQAYKYVYGSDDVSGNYFNVFKTLGYFRATYGTSVEIRFTQTPIFNDTYKVDDRFITGPYLHCGDKSGAKITAKDFFSFDIDDPKKELYDIIYHDYTAVWDKCDYVLDIDRFYSVAKDINNDVFLENHTVQEFLVKREVAERVTLSDIAENIDGQTEADDKL